RTPPAVICKGLSQRTATNLLNELAAAPCDLRVVRHLLREFRLPRVYVGFGILALSPLLEISGTSGLEAAGATLAGETALVALYLRHIRPLIKTTAIRQRVRPQTDPSLIPIARAVREISDANLKAIVGKIVGLYLDVQQRADQLPPALRAAEIRTLMQQALAAARTLENYELYLASRSLNDIKEKVYAVDLRLRATQDPQDTADLMETHQQLQREFQHYQAVQELHGRLYLGLLNVNALLQQIGDAPKEADTVKAEMEQLAADLGANGSETSRLPALTAA